MSFYHLNLDVDSVDYVNTNVDDHVRDVRDIKVVFDLWVWHQICVDDIMKLDKMQVSVVGKYPDLMLHVVRATDQI